MKTTLAFLMFVFALGVGARAQVAPAAVGPAGVPVGSNLQYALRYAQVDQMSTSYVDIHTSTASGSLNYTNNSDRRPFIMNYTGGYTWTLSGPGYETGQFHHMLLSQGFDWRKWKVIGTDDVSYLPQSPITGFSGLPGVGEPIGGTTTTPPTSQSILTLNTHVVDNLANGTVEHTLNFATTVSGTGSYELLRYPDGDGLDTNTVGGIAQINRRLDARNMVLGRYLYTNYSYPGYSVSFGTNTAFAGYQRVWSRNFTTLVAAGPQFVSSTDTAAVPSSTTVSVNATITYRQRLNTASVVYDRGTNGGAGYLLGGEVDQVMGNFQRPIGNNLTIGLTSGYQRTSGLNTNGTTSTVPGFINTGTTNAIYGGAETTWRLSRTLIVFANYTGTSQSTTSPLPSNALSQMLQVVGFGIGYSPRETHLRQ